MEPNPPQPHRDIPSQRKALYYAGMGVMVAGFMLFLSNFWIIPMSFGERSMGLESGSNGMWLGGMALRGIGGIVLVIIGRLMMVTGSRGAAGAGIILDPQKARQDVEPWARAGGGMLKDALEEAGIGRRSIPPNVPTPIIKIRCQACNSLNEETNKFCGQCGQQL